MIGITIRECISIVLYIEECSEVSNLLWVVITTIESNPWSYIWNQVTSFCFKTRLTFSGVAKYQRSLNHLHKRISPNKTLQVVLQWPYPFNVIKNWNLKIITKNLVDSDTNIVPTNFIFVSHNTSRSSDTYILSIRLHSTIIISIY